jgi:hypothetical protein
MKAPVIILALTLGVSVAAGQSNTDGFRFERLYADGEYSQYRLTSKVDQNGRATGEESAISTHSVMAPRDGTPFERIRWNSLESVDDSGRHAVKDIAEQVPAYDISLDPQGRIDLPKLTVPAMVGMVTDLNTFMVAISPRVGIQMLHRVGDSYTYPELLRGDFSNAMNTPLGQDCTELALSLIALDADTARVRSTFSSPSRPCLEAREPWMTPANFQMIRKSGAATADAFWGTESFAITTTLRRSDGRIINATMDNTLKLTVRTGCSPGLTDCKREAPLSMHRIVTLELLH